VVELEKKGGGLDSHEVLDRREGLRMTEKDKRNAKAVLFVLIGWSKRYDGTEALIGNHRHLKTSAGESGESRAFVRIDGAYTCGVGDGQITENSLDIVFVAKVPNSNRYDIVGVYIEPLIIKAANDWRSAKSQRVIFFDLENRPSVSAWPAGQGMRRWARRINKLGPSHPKLLSAYNKAMAGMPQDSKGQPTDPELEAFEGELRKRFVTHRSRESKLRNAKIREALQNNEGKLRCEVPGCGFDFAEKYGPVGSCFAVVHHLVPLSEVKASGTKNSLKDLAVVCANCHAMIHRGGECRDLATLIKRKPKSRQ
jgi:hypothetical protein